MMRTRPFYINDDLTLGTVYGVLLNDRATLQRLQPQFDSPPYKAAPKAPILYIKSGNTQVGEGAEVGIPAEPGQVRVDATIGLVVGKTATCVAASQAMEHVAGFVIASDLTLPHENYYRPAVVQRNRDGFCPMSRMYEGSGAFDPANANLKIAINEQPVYERSFATLVRPAAQLIADVTEFMTLAAGDVLLLGPGEGSPLARANDRVTITVPGLGELDHSLVWETLA